MTIFATYITEAIAARLRGCTAGAGFASNVGASVQTGQMKAGAADAPCLYIMPGRGIGGALYCDSVVEYTRAYELRAFVDLNSHPELSDCDLIDQIIWDVRRIIEIEPLPGADIVRFISDQPGYREDGGNLVGALINYEIVFTVNLSDPSRPA